MPDKVVADMLSSALRRVPRKHCGQLFELLQRTQNRVRYAQELQTLVQKAKATPADKALWRQMGELHALLGDWRKAIESFAAGDGKFAAMAQWEQKYPETGITELTTAKVADFWWEAGGGDAECTRAYRAHAAYWYRKAIENGSLPGLTKALAEKRIAEAEKELDAAEAAPQGVTEPKVAAVKRDPSQPPPKTLKLGNGADVEFVGCPAGSFMMGKEGDDNPRSVYRYHKVNITRPFWLSKYKVTHGMWNAYQKVTLTKEDHALGGMRRVHCVSSAEAEAFCEWVTKRFRSSLPKGYVVRLPTEAEWEYACMANVGDPNDSYVRMGTVFQGLTSVSESLEQMFVFPEVMNYAVTFLVDAKPRLEAAGVWSAKDEAKLKTYLGVKARSGVGAMFNGMEVGTKKPNVWGLYDMVGNLGEIVADALDKSLVQFNDRKSWNRRDQNALCYETEETDPLHFASQDAKRVMLRRGGTQYWGWAATVGDKHFCERYPCPFRLCIGPDLMKEKGFKK